MIEFKDVIWGVVGGLLGESIYLLFKYFKKKQKNLISNL
jgi:glycopeptide antibiotics resistance protein